MDGSLKDRTARGRTLEDAAWRDADWQDEQFGPPAVARERIATRLPGGGTRVAGRTWAKVLFVAVLVGLGFMQGLHMADAPETPVAYEDGRLVATEALAQALYDPATRRSGGPVAGRPFANAAGEQCRRFIDGQVSGVACRQDGDWRIEELRQVVADPDAGVRMAAPAGAAAAGAAPGVEAPRAEAAPKQN